MGKKVCGIFPIDISLQLLEQFQQTNSHFEEHFKVYLLCKNERSSLRNKRDINVRISLNLFSDVLYTLGKKIVIVCISNVLSL